MDMIWFKDFLYEPFKISHDPIKKINEIILSKTYKF